MEMNRNYTGKSGQLAVMAEFLIRGYNVAMPEVDEGDDIFVVHHVGTLWRIQVKSANCRRTRAGIVARFSMSGSQLMTRRSPDLMFVFAARKAGRWADFIVIRREELETLCSDFGAGKVLGSNVMFELTFTRKDVRCGGLSLQRFRNAWLDWPALARAA